MWAAAAKIQKYKKWIGHVDHMEWRLSFEDNMWAVEEKKKKAVGLQILRRLTIRHPSPHNFLGEQVFWNVQGQAQAQAQATIIILHYLFYTI